MKKILYFLLLLAACSKEETPEKLMIQFMPEAVPNGFHYLGTYVQYDVNVSFYSLPLRDSLTEPVEVYEIRISDKEGLDSANYYSTELAKRNISMPIQAVARIRQNKFPHIRGGALYLQVRNKSRDIYSEKRKFYVNW